MEKRLLLIVGIIFIIIAALHLTPTLKEPIPTYSGKKLTIGVLGDIPSIREEHILFEEITFSDLKKHTLINEYDSVFIMKKNLIKASKPKYVKCYKSIEIPFFFFESKKSYLPFVDESLSYEEVECCSKGVYATEIIYNNNQINFSHFYLYNDKKTDLTIKMCYSQVFKKIEQYIRQQQLLTTGGNN